MWDILSRSFLQNFSRIKLLGRWYRGTHFPKAHHDAARGRASYSEAFAQLRHSALNLICLFHDRRLLSCCNLIFLRLKFLVMTDFVRVEIGGLTTLITCLLNFGVNSFEGLQCELGLFLLVWLHFKYNFLL